MPRVATKGSNMRRSSVIEAHNVYAKYHIHREEEEETPRDDSQATPATTSPASGSGSEKFAQFHRVEKTGVIYATSRAAQ